jgi:hypothetical protein
MRATNSYDGEVEDISAEESRTYISHITDSQPDSSVDIQALQWMALFCHTAWNI